MARIAVVSRPKPDAEGTLPLYIRIQHGQKTRYVSLSLRVEGKHWSTRKQELKESHPNYRDFRELLLEKEQAAQKALLRTISAPGVLTVERIQDRVRAATEGAQTSRDDYLSYAWEIARGYERRGQINSWYRFRAILNKLGEYQQKQFGTKVLPFDDLTPAYLRRYMDYLAEEHGNNPNTISKNLAGLRTILYKAIREGFFPQDKNPFFHLTLTETKVKKERLSRDEIERLVNLKLKEGSSQWHSRNYFLFAMYMAGIRIGDVMQLRWKYLRQTPEGLRLKYDMDKTGGAKNLPVTPPAAAILSRYEHRKGKGLIFPALDDYDLSTPKGIVDATKTKTAQVNSDLEEIRKKAEIHTKLSTHVARHSFADLARKAGWSIYDVSKALGHSSIQQTQRYLAAFDEDDLDEKLRGLF